MNRLGRTGSKENLQQSSLAPSSRSCSLPEVLPEAFPEVVPEVVPEAFPEAAGSRPGGRPGGLTGGLPGGRPGWAWTGLGMGLLAELEEPPHGPKSSQTARRHVEN